MRTANSEVEEGFIQLIKEELNAKSVSWLKTAATDIKAEFDFRLTPNLLAEGEARELVRKIQEERKTLGCRLDQRITVELPSWPQEFTDYIKKETLAKELIKAKELKILPQ